MVVRKGLRHKLSLLQVHTSVSVISAMAEGRRSDRRTVYVLNRGPVSGRRENHELHIICDLKQTENFLTF